MKRVSSLEFAHDFEVKGVNLYMRLAAKTSNILAKKVFYSLAQQEVDHARRIDEISAQLKANKGWKPVTLENAGNVENQVKKFFNSASKVQLNKRANLKGYETAIKMEQKGYAAYEQFYNKAKGNAEKAFFKQMMAEENKHLEALNNVYAYLTGNEDWIQAEESRTWNWMNT